MRMLREVEVVYKKRKKEGEIQIKQSEDVYNTFKKLAKLPDEHFYVACLDAKNVIQASCMISKGGVDNAAVDIRSIARLALLCNASSVVLVHNHPSGSTDPSMDDKKLTEEIKNGLALLRIKTLDHIIIGHGRAFRNYSAMSEQEGWKN